MKNFLIITNYYKDSEARLTNHIKEYIEKKGGSCSTFFSNGETPGEAAPHRKISLKIHREFWCSVETVR